MTFNELLTQKMKELHARQAALYAEPEQQIARLKARLAASDYKAIKHSEGLICEEDYAPIKAERQAIRDEINALEAQMKGDDNG